MTKKQKPKIIVIMNQKGGIGKTTTAHALGTGLVDAGKKVLYIDLDPQANLTYVLGYHTRSIKSSVGDLMAGDTEFKQVVLHTDKGDLLPAVAGMASADIKLIGDGKESKLKAALNQNDINAYDYVIIDTPRGFGILTINALIACTHMIITTTADAFPLQAITTQLSEVFADIKKYYNSDMKVQGILLIKYQKQYVINRELGEMLDTVAETLGTKVFKTKIRDCVALREAQVKRQDIYSYAPKSNAAFDYSDFVKEILN